MRSLPGAGELCAAAARRVGEPLFGTASRVDLWLVLEVPGAWGTEVADSLGPVTAGVLNPVLQAVPRSRVLFVKGAPGEKRDTVRFYVAVTDELEPRLYSFDLEGYEALGEIDLFAVLAEDERCAAQRDLGPLYLVCTHGTHDRCCAKFGFPVYRSLARREPARVWQSSHVGGDRFAANVVCLPGGLYYGHVEPGDAEDLLGSTDQGRLYSPRWRGRACYPPPVQAAEYYLREAHEEWSIPAYRLWSHRPSGDTTEAAFLALSTGELHRLRVEPALLEGLRPMTCGTPEAKPVRGYRLLDHRVAPFAPETCSVDGLDFRLDPAAMRDYGFIYRLREETLRPCLDALGMAPEQRGPFLAGFDVTRHQLIYLGDDRIGAVSVVERSASLHLANLHLLPAYQHRGLGTAIVRDIQSRAAARGLPVSAQVLKVNPARAFYERLGFRIEGERGPRYRMIWEP